MTQAAREGGQERGPSQNGRLASKGSWPTLRNERDTSTHAVPLCHTSSRLAALGATQAHPHLEPARAMTYNQTTKIKITDHTVAEHILVSERVTPCRLPQRML